MDFERARFNMIEQQIRPWNVLDPSVLALLRKVPREQFVTTRQQALAFADLSIPLDHDQVMMQPKVEARLIQALALTRQDRVLEIGTGSGYLTALLAASAASVVSVEIYSALSLQAGARLQSAGFDTVDLKIGDGAARCRAVRRYHHYRLCTAVAHTLRRGASPWRTAGCHHR